MSISSIECPWWNKKLPLRCSYIFVFLNYRKNFLRFQERVRINHGKRDIEVLLFKMTTDTWCNFFIPLFFFFFFFFFFGILYFVYPYHCKSYKTIKIWSHHLVSEFWCFTYKHFSSKSSTEEIILTQQLTTIRYIQFLQQKSIRICKV